METSMTNIQSVIDYLDEIDKAYFVGRKNRWSRYSDEWTIFSTPLNREVRDKIKNNVPETPLLYIILPYWFNRSEMLELYFTKKSLFKKALLRKLQKQCEDFREDIKNGLTNKYENLSALDIARMSLKGAKV